MTRHPCHPMFVHFPIACWTLATGIDVVGMLAPLKDALGGITWPAVSHLLLWGGLLFSVPTVAAGIIDYVRLPERVQTSGRLAAHIGAMAAALLLFLVATLLRFRGSGFGAEVGWNGVMFEVAGALCLITGGYFASLVVFNDLQQASLDQQATRNHST